MKPEDAEPGIGRVPTVTAVLLIAHGSRQRAANDDLHQLAERLAAAGTYPIVQPCFLELAAPDIPTGGDHCVASGATVVLMVPYFLSAGVHLHRDLTDARNELSRRYPHVDFRLGSPLGPHELLDRLVEIRLSELARGDSWIRLSESVAGATEGRLEDRERPD